MPIVPGYFGDDQTLERLKDEAESIGYPVLIKASAGGGGKGMRVVEASLDFEDALDGAKREALAAFGDDSVMLEKYLSRPRHIEVQIIGDKHGKVIHLGERECSIQRRHQKVAEESPSTAISEETRAGMTGAALKLARAAGYENAGTMEFIYQDGEYHFLEMNTRLQVEHPVTEEALGLDIVQMQIRIAAGEPLELEQEEVRYAGHALEVRLYAEDPEKGFLPSIGTLRRLRLPGGLKNVRVDTGVEQGDAVSPFYDPMIAKIITSGETRGESIRVMQEALGYTEVSGVRTNLDFLRWLVAHPDFSEGDFSTRFIEEEYEPGAHAASPCEAILAGAFTLLANRDSYSKGSIWDGNSWRQAREDMPVALLVNGRSYDVRLSVIGGQSGHWWARVLDGEAVLYDDMVIANGPHKKSKDGEAAGTETIQIELGSGGGQRSITTSYDPENGIGRVEVGGRRYWIEQAPALSTETLSIAVHLKDEDNLESPMPGKVLKVMVGAGDEVKDGQPLVIVEAMKMEFTVKAPHDGKVEKVRYTVGEQVAVGNILVELEKREKEDEAEEDGTTDDNVKRDV